MKRIVLLLLLGAWFNFSYAQEIKGFYVNGFNNILGNTVKEDSLLLFAQNNNFNYLTLYDVHTVHNATPLTNVTTAQTFANFIKKAKTNYGIQEIGVAAENYWFFENVIHQYNLQHSNPNEKVDVYNFEFEFWISSSTAAGSFYCTTYLTPNGYPCNETGAFNFYKSELKKIDSLANTIGKKSEAYFGFFNTAQAGQIIQTNVDRVMLSVYVPSSVYNATYHYGYTKPRLQSLGSFGPNVKVITLLSAEPEFMQSWVTSNPYFMPYSDLSNKLSTETDTFKNNIQLTGIQWFAYSHLPKRFLPTSIQSPTYEEAVFDFNISPNPSYHSTKITIPEQTKLSDNASITILDYLGKVVITQKVNNTSIEINTSDLGKGFYFITLNNNGFCLTKKLMVL